MQDGIHPKYHPVVFVDAGANAEFVTRSTMRSKETREIDGVEHFVIRLDDRIASWWYAQISTAYLGRSPQRFFQHHVGDDPVGIDSRVADCPHLKWHCTTVERTGNGLPPGFTAHTSYVYPYLVTSRNRESCS